MSTGLPTANNRPSLPERTDTVVSPRVAALYHLTDRVTAWGAFNSGFRAPTLTELYRQFSVGAVTTRPNDQLGPERLKGGELGLNVAPMRNLTARLTWFDNRVEDPVSNVTMTPSQPNYATVCVGLAAGNCVQKQNLGQHPHLGHPDRRRIPAGHGLACRSAATSTTRRRSPTAAR